MTTRPRHRRGKRGGVKHKLREAEKARRATQMAAAKAQSPVAVKALRARLLKLATRKVA
jgi:hypothetical protein